MTIYDLAKQYSEIGLNIMPINGVTKKPLLNKWKHLELKRATDNELKEWFEDKNDIGIAVIHGHLSNTLAVDFDTYKKEFGEIPYTPVRVKTPRGGVHGFFKFNGKFTNSVNNNIAVDIKAEGGYTGIPPTFNKEVGKGYEWDVDGELEEALKKLPELPEEVYKAIKKNPNNEPFNPKEYLNVEEGSRNDALHRHACSMLAKGVDPEVAYESILGINARFPKPLPEYEVQQLFNSAKTFIDSQPNDSLTQRITIADGSDLRRVFIPKPLSELSSEKAEVSWIWEGYIAKGQLTLFSALWKIGKTTLIAQLLKSFETGNFLAGREVVKNRVLIISEESEGLWAKRRDDYELDLPVWIVPRPIKEKLNYNQWVSLIKDAAAFCEENKVDLVVIDTVSTFWNVKDEANASEVQAALLPLNYLTEKEVGVLLVHHFRKTSGEEATASRGSGVLPSVADIVAEFRRKDADNPESRQRVLTAYSRIDEPPPTIVIELVDGSYVTLGTISEVSKEAKLNKLLSLLPQAPSGKTVNSLLEDWDPVEQGKKPSRSTAIRYLDDLKKSGRAKVVGETLVKKTMAPLYGKTQIIDVSDNANQSNSANVDSEANNATQITTISKGTDGENTTTLEEALDGLPF